MTTPSANSSGNHKQSVASNDPVNTRAGELVASKVDLNLRGPMPLMFARYYAAQLATDGNLTSALGANWLTNFDAKLTTTTDTATVVMTDGRVLSFTKTNNAWLLASPLDLPFQIVQAGAGFVLGDPRSQRMWTFDAAGKLAKVEDGRGNAHTLNRDANGQLTSVDDGLGRTLSFAYNGAVADGQLGLFWQLSPATRTNNDGFAVYSRRDSATAWIMSRWGQAIR